MTNQQLRGGSARGNPNKIGYAGVFLDMGRHMHRMPVWGYPEVVAEAMAKYGGLPEFKLQEMIGRQGYKQQAEIDNYGKPTRERTIEMAHLLIAFSEVSGHHYFIIHAFKLPMMGEALATSCEVIEASSPDDAEDKLDALAGGEGTLSEHTF